MPPLRETQAAMRRALLDGEAEGLLSHLAAQGILAETQIAVYRNNVFASLTDVLCDAFPAICRLVDDRFFAYAAHEFIRDHPPMRPCLADYGAQFPDFLAVFPPCRELSYLGDVARFEWLLSRAAHAENALPIDPLALASLAPEDTPRLVLQLDPSLAYLASPWPIDRIWQANRRGADEGVAIDLGVGGVRLEIGRRDGAVVYRALGAATFAFRQALGEGATLDAATVLALELDEGFDIAAAFADLFRDGAVTSFALTPSMP
jgi:hypothetical protein